MQGIVNRPNVFFTVFAYQRRAVTEARRFETIVRGVCMAPSFPFVPVRNVPFINTGHSRFPVRKSRHCYQIPRMQNEIGRIVPRGY
jgi:hypothetical protein